MNDLKSKAVNHQQMPFLSVCFPRRSKVIAWILCLIIPALIGFFSSSHADLLSISSDPTTTLLFIITSSFIFPLLISLSFFLIKFLSTLQKQGLIHCLLEQNEGKNGFLEGGELETLVADAEKMVPPAAGDDGSPPEYSYCESEIIDGYSFTSEDSDFGWPFPGANVDCSDGSISDEESLIEIALPSGHYVGSREYEEGPKFRLRQKSPENMFGRLPEIINDMNEEENLIEIDISVGSIKCSRFGIQA